MSAPTLLIAYDGSSAARSAVRAAAALFPGARAVVASAHHEPASLEQAAAAARIGVPDEAIVGGIQALARAEGRAAEVTAAEGSAIATHAGLAAEARTTDAGATAWRAMRRLAGESAADVVVCGSRGLGPFSRAALGSTSSGLLHHADRPVLVVPDGGGDLTGPIVIGYDGSEGVREAIVAAGGLLSDGQAIVINVWESPALSHDLDGYLRSVATKLAERGAALAREAGLEARPQAVEAAGPAWHGLLAAAGSAGAAAVVVGSRGHGALASAFLGSVSSGLVHHADVPVLVVPTAVNSGPGSGVVADDAASRRP